MHKNQQCAVNDKKIHVHLHNLRNITTLCRGNGIKGLILSVDQEKAFNWVEHDFLHKMLDEIVLKSYIKIPQAELSQIRN